jgi:mono/diheme cytochrome c family protein
LALIYLGCGIFSYSFNLYEVAFLKPKCINKMKKLPQLGLIVVFITTASFTLFQTKPWNVSADKAKAVNAVKSNAASIAEGKTLWITHCASCHGKTGLGDGTKAVQLETTPPDFTKAALQGQTDGSLFYKTSEGRGDMPGFKKKIPEQEDLWNLVNFIRSLKK